MFKNNGTAYYNFSKWEAIKKVLNCISNGKDNTIPLISKKTGLSYTATKNIIEDLISSKIITESFEHSNYRRGRPAKKYTIRKPVRIIIPNEMYDYLSIS
ncbi:MAG: hypothetical protein ACTSYR_04830, partial [Candidatus Odinarchaeia archaeon]